VEASVDRYQTSGVGVPFGKDEDFRSQGQLLEAVYFAKAQRDWVGLGQFSSHEKNPFIPDEASQKGPKGCCRPAWAHVGRQSERVHPSACGIEDRGSEWTGGGVSFSVNGVRHLRLFVSCWKLERETGIEPATSSLGTWQSIENKSSSVHPLGFWITESLYSSTFFGAEVEL
jgi:hypothetical protein